MSNFELFTQESAPEGSKALLQKSVAAFGMIPNLHAVMAESPELLDAYQQLHTLAQQTSFNKEELTVVWQTINVEHGCHYCVPAHSAIAKSMGVDDSIVAAIRGGQNPSDSKLAALRQFTLTVVRQRGVVAADAINAFYAAGFTKQNVLEVILILSQKVISNYVNHVADTPIDEPFKAFV